MCCVSILSSRPSGEWKIAKHITGKTIFQSVIYAVVLAAAPCGLLLF